jgi:hypothetical protein
MQRILRKPLRYSKITHVNRNIVRVSPSGKALGSGSSIGGSNPSTLAIQRVGRYDRLFVWLEVVGLRTSLQGN